MQNPFETEERRAFRENVARFVAAEITPNVNAWDEAGEVPWALHQGLGALGIFGLGVDEAYGGLGFDDIFMRAAFSEELARCGATGVGAAVGGRIISIGPLHKLASDEIKDAVLADIVAGRVGSSLAITEPSGGSDVANIKTAARRDGDDFVLTGQKAFITGGMKSDFFVVGARTGGAGLAGISLFFVPADTPGFSRADMGPKMGWWASDTAALYLDEVRVPARYLMGEENRGFLSIMDNFNYERITMVAIMLGMMKVCFEHSVEWAKERETFGKPLIRHQVIRHKLADMSARIDMIEAYLNQICWLANEGPMPVAEISKAKFSASTALEFVASQAMQILGGAGYLRGNPVERMYREVKVQAIGGG
jgi:acyl-CoA dehydrogenase